MNTDDLDFIVHSSKRTIHKVLISSRQQTTVVPKGLCELDMRVIKLEFDNNNIATIQLMFKLDYYPERKEDVYTIFLVHDISIYDKNRVLEKDPTGDLSVACLATYYKESGERLFIELRDRAKALSNPVKGDFTITDDQAEKQTKIIMGQWMSRKQP